MSVRPDLRVHVGTASALPPMATKMIITTTLLHNHRAIRSQVKVPRLDREPGQNPGAPPGPHGMRWMWTPCLSATDDVLSMQGAPSATPRNQRMAYCDHSTRCRSGRRLSGAVEAARFGADSPFQCRMSLKGNLNLPCKSPVERAAAREIYVPIPRPPAATLAKKPPSRSHIDSSNHNTPIVDFSGGRAETEETAHLPSDTNLP